MKVYKIVCTTQQDTTFLLWDSSEAEANLKVSNVFNHPITAKVVPVDIPTNKTDLIIWLNTYMNKVPT